MLANANRFQWRAVYNDGSHLMQIDYDGNKHSYSDIDRTKLEAFEMYEGGVRVISIRFKPGQRLIWRRRVLMQSGGIKEVCHIIGKQETIDGKNYQGIIGLFESDGRIEVTGKFEEGHPWFSPVSVHESEGEDWAE